MSLKWNKENKDKCRKSSREWAARNREKVRETSRKWRATNPDHQREYREKNKTKNTEYHRIRRQNDIQFRLANNLRCRLNRAIKRNSKVGSAVKDLGCSIEELVIKFNLLFQEEMSWDNYGEWEIDHIIPLSAFNLSDREQFLQACHYTNLQPLWKHDNIKKWIH